VKPFRIAVEYARPEPTASARAGVVRKTDLLITSLTIDPQVGSFLVVRCPVSSLFAVQFGAFWMGNPRAQTPTHNSIGRKEPMTTSKRLSSALPALDQC